MRYTRRLVSFLRHSRRDHRDQRDPNKNMNGPGARKSNGTPGAEE
jgi:hypothetical protein